MANKYFDIVVNSLMKFKGKLINVARVEKLLRQVIDEDFASHKLYKLIYYLKNRGYLYTIKKNLFFVKNPEHECSHSALLDKFYRIAVKQHCNDFLTSRRYIGGLKALELNISSFTIPDDLLVVNTYKQSNEVIMFDKQISFKRYATAKENLFSFFYKFTKKIAIGRQSFYVAGLELSLLESLYNPSLIHVGYITELVKKIIRERRKELDISIWEKILRKNKHHSSINRIYKIVGTVDPVLAADLKVLIKKVSYFI